MNAHPSSLSDRELLELAAKAAGIRTVTRQYSDVLGVAVKEPGTWVIGRWNPLENDGDALRLAVLIGMTVYPAEKTGTGLWVNVCIGHGPGDVEVFEKFEGDSLIATRRAIVRAAAAFAQAK